MMQLHVETPLYESAVLGACCNKRVSLKMECFQPPGSYKIRGIGRLCALSVAEGAERLVASSAGNAGYAVAYAGSRLGVGVTVVVPAATPRPVQEKIRRLGAEVLPHGEVWDEANEKALQLARNPATAYIPPFDHPAIWEGHATMIDEAARQFQGKPGAVVLSVGGGGLMSGVLQGMWRNGWDDVPLIAAEPEGAASLAASVEAGRPVELDRIDTIAGSLGVKRVADRAFQWCSEHPVLPVRVTDMAALRASRQFADDHRVLVEPASGVALSVLYDNRPELGDAESVLAVVCGGIGVSMERFAEWEAACAV
ncbi:MAG: pyridoxal-phosphate dependent enzyme [Synergistales bacterium]|nr:pyridoxal-phosphate dependent enzyme [Synergistales bacterium]